MKNLSSDPITTEDVKEYLNDYSDFGFEIKVLQKLVDLRFECQHGGTYEDPITGKNREFDIRALTKKNYLRIHLSVECKNLHENFPLLLHCLERKENESYNELILTFNPDDNPRDNSYRAIPNALKEFSKSIRVDQHLYPQGEYVAKSADQVGRRSHNNEIVSNDGEVFDKISQAINSSQDLISEAHYLDTHNNKAHLTFVCPVLVIPDSTLWQIKYSNDGIQVGDPKQVEHISYYIGQGWSVGSVPGLYYTLSHLEIVTFSGIEDFVEKYLGNFAKLSEVINWGGNKNI